MPHGLDEILLATSSECDPETAAVQSFASPPIRGQPVPQLRASLEIPLAPFRAGEACRMFEVPNRFDRPVAGKQCRCPSVITLKPVNYDHFKTGHSGWPQT